MIERAKVWESAPDIAEEEARNNPGLRDRYKQQRMAAARYSGGEQWITIGFADEGQEGAWVFLYYQGENPVGFVLGSDGAGYTAYLQETHAEPYHSTNQATEDEAKAALEDYLMGRQTSAADPDSRSDF